MNDDKIQVTTKLAWWKVAAAYIGLIIFTTLLVTLLNPGKMYYNLAAGMIISWIISLIVYYTWAIYFYNINMGWTDADWEELEIKKDGQPGLLDDEPIINPHSTETLGLPPGTVRATLALSLLVGGFSLMLASLELPYKLEQNQFFIDNYDFLKTAFLMMVAFYFGNKSLEYLQPPKEPFVPNVVTPEDSESALNELQSPVKASEAKAVIKANKAPEIHDIDETGDFDDTTAQG